MEPKTTLLVVEQSRLTGKILKILLNPQFRVVVRQRVETAKRWLIAHHSQVAAVLTEDQFVAVIAPLVHKLNSKCSVIALTHSSNVKLKASLRASGADKIVRKPFDLIVLKRALSDICKS